MASRPSAEKAKEKEALRAAWFGEGLDGEAGGGAMGPRGGGGAATVGPVAVMATFIPWLQCRGVPQT